jgi:Phosphotransferase enzyme family
VAQDPPATPGPARPDPAALRDLASAVRRVHAHAGTSDDRDLLRRHGLRRLPGGRNSAVYAARLDGLAVCLKLHRVDERDRAGREWRALRLLTRHAAGLAPMPYLYDPAPPRPVVAMELLPGQPLGGRHLDRRQLEALADVHAGLYRITPAKAGRPFQMAVGQPSALLARTASVLDGPGFSTASACHQEAARRWRRWRSGPDPGRLLEPAPLVFSRGDPNLANCLWDGERIRVVDLEYAGWLDRAVDLADLVEHPRSRGTPDQAWTGLVERLILDQPERMRFDAARRLLAFSWLARSLAVHDDPPADVSPIAQLHRVTTLLPPARPGPRLAPSH